MCWVENRARAVARAHGPLLAVDCSTAVASLALVTPEAVFERSREATRPSDNIAGEVSELLGRAGLRPTDLNRIIVGVGPGSFTGVRVGMALAQGMVQGAGLALGGVSSLMLMASPGRTTAIALAGRRGVSFVGCYRWDGEVPVAVLADRAFDHGDVDRGLVEAECYLGAWPDPDGEAPAPRALLGCLGVEPPSQDPVLPNYLQSIAVGYSAELP